MSTMLADVVTFRGAGNDNVLPTTQAGLNKTLLKLCLMLRLLPDQFREKFPFLYRAVVSEGYVPHLDKVQDDELEQMLDHHDTHCMYSQEAQAEVREFFSGQSQQLDALEYGTAAYWAEVSRTDADDDVDPLNPFEQDFTALQSAPHIEYDKPVPAFYAEGCNDDLPW